MHNNINNDNNDTMMKTYIRFHWDKHAWISLNQTRTIKQTRAAALRHLRLSLKLHPVYDSQALAYRHLEIGSLLNLLSSCSDGVSEEVGLVYTEELDCNIAKLDEGLGYWFQEMSTRSKQILCIIGRWPCWRCSWRDELSSLSIGVILDHWSCVTWFYFYWR